MEKKGHFPVKALSAGRLSYFCPLPWHTETKPSFYVWTNAEYENFYCFGCQSRYNIIHLVSMLDGISVRESITKLSDGKEFSLADEKELIDRDWEDLFILMSSESQDKFSQTLLEISDICGAFLKSVDYNENEVELIDNLWQIVDDSLCNYNFEAIEKIRREIGTLILNRKERLQSYEIDKLRHKYG